MLIFGTSAKKRRLLKAQEGKWPGPSLATSLSHCCCRFCWWFCQGKLLPQTCDGSWMASLKYAYTLSPISHNHASVENWAPKWFRKRSYWRYTPFSTKNHDVLGGFGRTNEFFSRQPCYGFANFVPSHHHPVIARWIGECFGIPEPKTGEPSSWWWLSPNRKISLAIEPKLHGHCKLLDIWIYTWILWLNLDEW